MAVNDDGKTIPTLNPGEGIYYQMLAEGINLLQDFTSAKWTDYNEHDPGLTILENVVFALTEIINKTGIPLADILTQYPGMKLESGDNAFFIASDILTTNPVTSNDYKKLIIDRVSNVRNVHFEYPSGSYTEINGVYNIYLELSIYYPETNKQKEEDERVIKAVRALYMQHRNLCEDLYQIIVYKPYYLEMQIQAQLNSTTTSVDQVLTSIFEVLNNYLSHAVTFYSLTDLQNKGISTDEIFDGPRLENGFILDSDLTEPLQVIQFSEIIKRLSRIQQIKNIEQFNLVPLLRVTGILNSPEERIIEVPEGFTPYLLFPSSANQVIFWIDGIQIPVDLTSVKNDINIYESVTYAKQKNSSSEGKIEIPQGQFRNIPEFATVRDQFPANYRIGANNMPSLSNPLRLAQARQLKAFLLPIEQIMGNFLAQLQHIYTLFDTKSKNKHSYFYEMLQDMNQVTDLIAKPNVSDTRALMEWNETLKTINDGMDIDASARLNQVANNLLLRFAEEVDSYTLNKIDSNVFGTETQDSALSTKHKLINKYAVLSYYRDRSINYTKAITSKNTIKKSDENIVGLIYKLCILLNIEYYQTGSLTDVIFQSGIRMYGSKDGFDIHSEKLQPLLGGEPNEWMVIENMLLIDQGVGNLENTVIYVGNEKTLLEEVLLNGVLRSKYEIKESNGDHHKKHKKYYIIFSNEGQVYPVHITHSEERAEEILDKLIAFLGKVNRECEGMYLVEHLLLAPTYTDKNFGFEHDMSKLNPEIEVVFVHAEHKSLFDRDTDMVFIQNYCYPQDTTKQDERENLTIVESSHGFRLHLKNDQDELIALSRDYYTSYDKVNHYKTLINSLTANNSNEDAFDPQMYAYYGPSRENEKFFNFQMSFFLPDWPARFQDKQFQKLFTSILDEQAPIQIVSSIYWLNILHMMEFEKLYFAWLKQMRHPESKEELQKAKFKLLCFIKMSVSAQNETDA